MNEQENACAQQQADEKIITEVFSDFADAIREQSDETARLHLKTIFGKQPPGITKGLFSGKDIVEAFKAGVEFAIMAMRKSD